MNGNQAGFINAVYFSGSNPKIIDTVIDKENNLLIITYMKDNSMLMSNPPPPNSYYREIYSFENLKLEKVEIRERIPEQIKWIEK